MLRSASSLAYAFASRARWSLAVAFLAVACTLMADVDALGDGECGREHKACGDQCVNTDRPAFGCATPSCSPCALQNAVAGCDPAGACAIASCVGTFEDCDGEAENGCEIDVAHDPASCGGCEADPCSVPHGEPGCRAGECSIRTCASGWDDCNAVVDDGCETPLGNDENCGMCEERCDDGTTCVDATCVRTGP